MFKYESLHGSPNQGFGTRCMIAWAIKHASVRTLPLGIPTELRRCGDYRARLRGREQDSITPTLWRGRITELQAETDKQEQKRTPTSPTRPHAHPHHYPHVCTSSPNTILFGTVSLPRHVHEDPLVPSFCCQTPDTSPSGRPLPVVHPCQPDPSPQTCSCAL